MILPPPQFGTIGKGDGVEVSVGQVLLVLFTTHRVVLIDIHVHGHKSTLHETLSRFSLNGLTPSINVSTAAWSNANVFKTKVRKS